MFWELGLEGDSHSSRVAINNQERVFSMAFDLEKVFSTNGTNMRAHAFLVLCPWGLRLSMDRLYAGSRLR